MAPSRLSYLTLFEPNTRHEQLLGHTATVGHSGLFVLFPWGMRDLHGENQESARLKRGNRGIKGVPQLSYEGSPKLQSIGCTIGQAK